ncbi:zinc ribbon domain-containing protein [Bartonella sp. DGB2]|uniref:zinc ribbon domain-containing protein n=1 Tax=Bartonella sp. DGB2 TaxID=3388426 RepID=UPI00398FC3D9
MRGLVQCGCCQSALTAVYTRKKNCIYTYYKPTKQIHFGAAACKMGPIPAGELDALVVGQIKAFIQSPELVSQVGTYLQQKAGSSKNTALALAHEALKEFERFWQSLKPQEAHELVKLLVRRVVVITDEVQIDMAVAGRRSCQ